MVMKHLEKRLDDILENYIIQEVYTVSPTAPFGMPFHSYLRESTGLALAALMD